MLPPLPDKLSAPVRGIKNGHAPKRRGRPPGVKQNQHAINMAPDDWEVFKALCVKHGTSAAVVLGELVQRKVNGPAPEPAELPKTAKAKLEAAIRLATRRKEAELQAKWQGEIEAHVRRLKEQHVPRWKADAERAAQARASYEKLLNGHQALFSEQEFKLILSCLHPDGERTLERKGEAFRLFNGKKLQLTKAP